MNLLSRSAIRSLDSSGNVQQQTLPGLLAALARGEVASFPALRPHQRHAVHAFLCQLAAIALHRAGDNEPAREEATWRDLLRALTPDWPDDEPWSLAGPPDKPALLQPPLPGGGLTGLKNRLVTPDQLDMLVTSKNHDLKQAVMAEASAEDWLFALITLQTMEGYSGRTRYGISRMNGGFANRAAISLTPPGGPSAQWRRDVASLLALRADAAKELYAAEGGLALLWLAPWDGATSLAPDKLDPYYIEICRQVRLVEENGRLHAYTSGSKAPRIVPLEGGVTGDPWSPTEVEKGGRIKALTVNGAGFGYRRMVKFLFDPDIRPAPLQQPSALDAPEGLEILARALVRGEGKTEGYHERRVRLSRVLKSGFRPRISDPAGQAASERVELAGTMQNRVLKFALLMLFQNGPDKVDPGHRDSERKAEIFLHRFDTRVDRDFFPALWRELEAPDGEPRRAARQDWLRGLHALAAELLAEAEHEAARSSRRSWRALARARDALEWSPYRVPLLQPYFPRETKDAG